MLIGAHVSTAGGLDKAIERGAALGCESIQIFNQSPRMWRPTAYSEENFAAFRAAMAASPVNSVVIHAIYLINPAGSDKQLREKSIASLTHALWVGAGIGAEGVVLHSGALKGGPRGPAKKRAANFVKEALAETEKCPVLLENTAGNEPLLGRTFGELAELIELAGGGERIGSCLDSCHLHASGYEISDNEAVGEVADEFDQTVGINRLRCLHLNDSRDPLGSSRDRHANLGEGEIGTKGLAAFLSEPRFDGLPVAMETPGPDRHGPVKADVTKAKRLRRQGLKAR
ncbi:MAG: deoxyribonuclease IV [Solirubrobacterales bacterium]